MAGIPEIFNFPPVHPHDEAFVCKILGGQEPYIWKEALVEYTLIWLKAYRAEKNITKRENTARHAANCWLREVVGTSLRSEIIKSG